MIFTILCAALVSLLVSLSSATIGGDLLRSRYLIYKKVYPSRPRYFWFLISSAVVALILSAIVMPNWRYPLLVTLVITLVVGYAVLSQSLRAKNT